MTPSKTQRVAAQARRRFLDLTESLLVVLDDTGAIALLNRSARELLGFEAGSEVGVSWIAQCVPNHARGHISQVFDAVLEAGDHDFAVVHSPVIAADGSLRTIAWHNTELRDDCGTVIGTVSSGMDVTGQLAASEALDMSQRELSEMKYALDQASIVAITDVKGRITYCNDKFCEISGYARSELIGQDHRILNSGLHSKAFIRDLWVTIARGSVWRGEIRNHTKTGEIYWVDTTIVPFLDDKGRPYQYVSIRNDVTDRVLAEASLRERTALARLGEMASVVAHEVKNPLAGIGGALQVIVRRLPEGTSERVVIGDILKRIELLNETMEDLLDYARPRTLKVSELPVAALLESVVEQVGQDPRLKHATLTVDVTPPDLTAPLDQRHMAAALLNLTLNAAQALGQPGNVVLRAQRRGDSCCIEVADDGPGVPEKLRDRIFEPFFTTRHTGTGLGLAIVRQTAERHGGTVALRCPPRGGTVVELTLPLTATDGPQGG